MKDFRLKFMKNRLSVVGSCMILFIIALALLAPIITTDSPFSINLDQRFLPPSSQHFFGTDHNGGDLYSKIIYGSRLSLLVAFSVVFLSVFIGLILGSISGYLGGWWDMGLMRLIDMIYAFPGFLLILFIVSVMQNQSINQLIFAMSITGWATYARLVRGEIMHLKEKDYVQSAIALGCSPVRIVSLHLWPNLVGPIIVQASFGMAVTIITESSLSFLGVGAPPDAPSWGNLLNSGRQFLIEAPYMSVFPGMAILILVMGFNLLGDGLRDILDPKKQN